MKILLYDTTLSFLTPGGKTTHVNKLHKELIQLGLDIEFAQWWNKAQEDYDLIHSFSPYICNLVDQSHRKGKKIILTLIMDIQANKPIWKQRIEIFCNKIQSFFPFKMNKIEAIKAIPKFDHIVFMNKFDRDTALRYYPGINPEKTSIISHAYDPNDMITQKEIRIETSLPPKYLISCANIDWRKQSSLLAQLAKKAKVPIVFIGKGNKNDPYYNDFIKEVDNKFVFYLGYVDTEVKDYLEKNASGFALLSLAESGCIAVYEAAAYGLPLFLSNLPWAWDYKAPKHIHFCEFRKERIAISQLKNFYNNAKRMDIPPFEIETWNQIAEKYKRLYLSLIE